MTDEFAWLFQELLPQVNMTLEDLEILREFYLSSNDNEKYWSRIESHFNPDQRGIIESLAMIMLETAVGRCFCGKCVKTIER